MCRTCVQSGPACKGHTLLLKGHTLLEEALARGRQDGSAGLCVEDCQAHSLVGAINVIQYPWMGCLDSCGA
jgi:hypothetical protein